MSGGRRAKSWFACILIVAAFHARLSAATAVSEDVPVPGGVGALAHSLHVDPPPDPALFMYEMARLVYEVPEARDPTLASALQAMRQPANSKAVPLDPSRTQTDLVPVPLTVSVWSDAIFRRKISPDKLVFAIIGDRQAALMCRGLALLDDETLAYLATHQAVLRRLYERSAPLLAAFGGSIRIRADRVVPPAGPGETSLWEVAVGEKTTRADRFIVSLFERSDGKLAYLYDLVFRQDPARRSFVLGSWLPEPARSERFHLLTTVGLDSMREWRGRTLPFNRSSFDFGMAVARLAVGSDGTPADPSARSLWARVIGTGDTADARPFDAFWMFEHVVGGDVRQRSERLDQVTFAQRVFHDQRAELSELVYVVKAMPRFRSLVLEFERAGFTDVETYAAALRHAAKLTGLDGRRGYVVQAQFQGALALVLRMISARSIERAKGEQLVVQLAALPMSDGYAGGVAKWIRTALYPLLPGAHDVESAVIAGLSGPSIAASGPRVMWEGQAYRLDLAAGERKRLERVREKQRGPSIDVPLQLAEAARLLTREKVTVDDMVDAATQFEALASDLPRRSREEEAENLPPGVSAPPPAPDALKTAAVELSRAAKARDPKRAPGIAEPLVEVADDLLARSLLSLTYALSLGDPEGTALLANDVSQRHDFGFAGKEADLRARTTWAIPRQEVSPGVSWHVSGSLLALDAGLATLALRRVATDHVLEAPKLSNNAHETLATSVSLMDPHALQDADRDAIAEAIERGSERMLAAVADAAALDQLADELNIEPPRRRALRWTLAHTPERVNALFSTTELLLLGGADLSSLHAWGMAVIPATGCLCSRLFEPARMRAFAFRPQLGLSAVAIPDLNFRVAVVLKELALPAALAKVVLSAAVQDFIDEVRPTDDADWLSLSRTAREVPRERIEDYIAAATATGPLMPEPARTPEALR